MELIVEIGNSHEGSLGIATSFVDMAKESGASCVKFQMHLAEFEGMPDEPFRINFSLQDISRQDYWKRVNFSFDEWLELAKYVKASGLEFLCTPFSNEAAEWLFNNNLVKRWKVGSGDAINIPLLEYLIKTDLPIIISTGLISWDEIIYLREFLIANNFWHKTTLMHCVSEYPTRIENSSLNIISELKTLGCEVGLSDHSGNWIVPLKAISLGISILEVHMTPHKKFFGPDTVASLTPDEIRKIHEIDKTWSLLDTHIRSKEEIFQSSLATQKMFRKGIYWSRDISSGQKVTKDDFKFRKPLYEIDSKDYKNYLNKIVNVDVAKDTPLLKEHFYE
jgi:N,N'-diacetyllegionaminate synthase